LLSPNRLGQLPLTQALARVHGDYEKGAALSAERSRSETRSRQSESAQTQGRGPAEQGGSRDRRSSHTESDFGADRGPHRPKIVQAGLDDILLIPQEAGALNLCLKWERFVVTNVQSLAQVLMD
jgi:hypothetical protein